MDYFFNVFVLFVLHVFNLIVLVLSISSTLVCFCALFAEVLTII